MTGHLLMSEKERNRLGPIQRAATGEIKIRVAAEQTGMSYRQAKRLVARYKQEGDQALVHRARGKPSPRQVDPDYKRAVLELYQHKYRDFGPTLASENLGKRDGKSVNAETLRLWLIAAKLWEKRTPKARHRTWRKRKACFGEMVQLDGSVHDWFEGRSKACFVMNMIDDATGNTHGLFADQESTWAAMDVLRGWIELYGIPASLYVDRRNVYVTDREPTREEQLAGQPALTQFGKVCQKLGVRIIEAHSPQAKGRVERNNGVLQDRLIKDMRLDGISDLDAANAYLPGWLKGNNERFAVAPRSDVDMHRPVPAHMDLDDVFCLEEERSVDNDYLVRYCNRFFQIKRQKHLPKPGSKVTVQLRRNGTLVLVVQNHPLEYEQVEGRPGKPKPVAAQKCERLALKPADDHPWRKRRYPDVDPREVPRLAEELASTYLGDTLAGIAATRAQGSMP